MSWQELNPGSPTQPLLRGEAHLRVQPLHRQRFVGAAGLHGARSCRWLLWRREAPFLAINRLVSCHWSQLSWLGGWKWEENQALTSKGLPDLLLVAGLIVTQCLKTPDLFSLYIFFHIFLFIYISLQTHNERQPRSWTGKESSTFSFFFSLYFYFKLYSNFPVLQLCLCGFWVLLPRQAVLFIAPELYEAEFNLQSWLVQVQPSPKCVWSEAA